MSRIRSPNYPQLSLSEALSRVSQVLAKERQHSAPRDVVIKHLGYNGVHGASLGALSAVLKYGLLERNGEDYRVSDRAMTILHPHTDEEKAQALQEAARAPALFSELLEHYKGALPSDENLSAYLVRKGFAESAITSVIDAFRETMSLVGKGPQVHTGEGNPKAQASTMNAVVASRPAAPGQPVILSGGYTIELPFEPKIRVSLTDRGLEVVAGIVDQIGIDRLIAVLQANKALLPKAISNSEQDASQSDLLQTAS